MEGLIRETEGIGDVLHVTESFFQLQNRLSAVIKVGT